MMDNSVTEIGSKDFPHFGAFGDKADRGKGGVGMRPQFFCKPQQVFFCIELEFQGIGAAPLVFSAAEVCPVEVFKRKYRTVHFPERTGKARLLLELSI
jgi:hypothetical protein